jgi:MoxR-like ATPase
MKYKDYEPLVYDGTKQEEQVEVLRGDKKVPLDNYIPDPELVKAVNLALLLEKPLLVMGEPGCGKSLLAKAVAFDLYGENMYEYYREWHIKSTSKAKEGLYEFDYLHRLRDATVSKNDGSKKTGPNSEPAKSDDITSVDKYIHFGPMGEAFMLSKFPGKRAVLLIDEIDKADIDFPNDLLNELDRMEFDIHEKKIEQKEMSAAGVKEEEGIPVSVKAKYRPIVIITSNSEKDLPDAFLRRCIFHYIEPLSSDKLKEIVAGRYYAKGETNPLIDQAVKLFIELRSTIKNEMLSIGKNVSTSEFVTWFEALKHYTNEKEDGSAGNNPRVKQMIEELSRLDKNDITNIPFRSALLKNINAVIRFNETKR